MRTTGRDIAAKKIANMPAEQVLKLLIFMAGMEAQQTVDNTNHQQPNIKDTFYVPQS